MKYRNLSLLKAILCVPFSIVLLTSNVQGQDAEKMQPVERKKLAHAEHAEKVAAAIGWGELSAKLKHMAPSPKSSGPRWSPKGTKVKLQAKGDRLVGKLAIGKTEFSVRWQLAEPGDDATFSIDLDRDGEMSAPESMKIK
ncbi:MAG: hypothetical protein AB8G99_08380, partial [Planctomycetaceae bacterium]